MSGLYSALADRISVGANSTRHKGNWLGLRCVLVRSVDVGKHHVQKQLVAVHNSSPREVRAGTQVSNLEVESDAEACSVCFLIAPRTTSPVALARIELYIPASTTN